MKKKLIKFEEADLKYYEFRDTNILKNEKLIERMLEKIDHIPLDDNMKKAMEEMNEDHTYKSFDFLTEFCEYLSQNFLFNDNQKLFEDHHQ